LEGSPLWITGESYAGKFIPNLATYIDKHPEELPGLQLKGISIGNGWVKPLAHYQSYVDFFK